MIPPAVRPARILVLRGGALGDGIVTLPALHALRARWPDAHLELIGYPHLNRLALADGVVTRARSLDEARIARLFAWNARLDDDTQRYFASFDIVVQYLHNPDHVLDENLRRCGVKILLTAPPLVERCPAPRHFLAPLENLAIYDADPVPRLRLPPAPPDPAASVILHPGSGGTAKCWPLEHFLDLARRLETSTGRRPLFVTGDAERERHPDLDARLAGWPRLHQPDLLHLATLLRAASRYVGNDSGVTHLAAACACPTLALFGPTDPDVWAPAGPHVRTLTAPRRDLRQLDPETVGTFLLNTGTA